jgi:hypothetical protein
MLDRWVILPAHRRRFGMGNPVYEQIQANGRGSCAAQRPVKSQAFAAFAGAANRWDAGDTRAAGEATNTALALATT